MNMNDKKQFIAHEMEISYRICAEISQKSILWREENAIGKILRQLCEWKGVKIIEAEMYPDPVYRLAERSPKIAVSNFMGYLKGKSSTMLYEQFGEQNYKYRS